MSKQFQLLLSFSFLLLLTKALSGQDIEKIDLKKPIQLSGSLNFQLENYSAKGIEQRKKPFSWMLSGAPVLTVGGVPMPFSFLFSNFENRYYQPFNQYGISPKFKWATLHAGYRNIQFSPFTLAGYRMLGGGVELNPGKFRFGFMYGRLNKSTSIDSAQFVNPLAFRPPDSYTRMAYAVKLGVGSDRGYFDISYLKGWDKQNSLADKFRDSIPAAENMAVGLSWKIPVGKKISWQTDLGLSHYISDRKSDRIVLDSSYPKIVRSLTDLFSVRLSSSLLTAGETKLSYQGKVIGLGLQYRRVDPDYQSMGAYFFQTDIEQYSLLPSLRLLKGKLMMSGSVGFQRDNLYRQKLATSERITGNLNVNWNPLPTMGVNFNYSNFGITQNPLRTSATDEIFKQVSQSFVIVPYLNLIGDDAITSIQLIGSLQSLNSPVKTINTTPDQHTLFGTLIGTRTWTKKQFSANASINYNNTNLPTGDIGSFGFGAGASAPLLKNKLILVTNATYNSNTYNGVANGYTLLGDAALRFRLIKRNSVQLSFNYLKNESKDQTAIQSFDEKTFRIGYGISF